MAMTHCTKARVPGLALMLGALGLGFASAGCHSDDNKERCAQVLEATCPADKPQVNFTFPYSRSECERKLDAPCSSEFGDYLDCLYDDPTCCSTETNEGGTLDCIYSSCNQDAYIACVQSYN